MEIDEERGIVATSPLRRRAEDRLKAESPEGGLKRATDKMQRLCYELHIHQIELEMQNEELKAARHEVEKSLEKFSDLFEFAPMGYFILDRTGAINSANLKGASFLGIERTLLLGRRFMLFVTEEYRASFNDFLAKVHVSSSRESCEVMLLKESNHPFFVHIEGLVSSPGEECRIALIDITHRKKMEERALQAEKELELLNKSLETRVVEMAGELCRKDQAIIQLNSLAVMGDMISNIAHQWRQPLNTVALIIQNVQCEYESGTLTPEEMKSEIHVTMEILLEMSQTIDDFRSFFKPDKEKHEFSINEAVHRAISLVSAALHSHHIPVNIIMEDDVTAIGYQNEYSQVLLNMFSNSCNICSERNLADCRINIHITRENERSVLYFRDNCGGIPDDVLPRIFDQYFTTRDSDKGSGIGLYISKMIIEQNMGGSLTASNVGSGAEFRIEV